MIDGITSKCNETKEKEEKKMKGNKYRVWWIRNPPRTTEYYEFSNYEKAVLKLDSLAQKDAIDPAIHDNIGGVEILIEGEWLDKLLESSKDSIFTRCSMGAS